MRARPRHADLSDLCRPPVLSFQTENLRKAYVLFCSGGIMVGEVFLHKLRVPDGRQPAAAARSFSRRSNAPAGIVGTLRSPSRTIPPPAFQPWLSDQPAPSVYA